jgi:hypothetical protein
MESMLKRTLFIPVLLAVFPKLALLPLSQTNESGSSMLRPDPARGVGMTARDFLLLYIANKRVRNFPCLALSLYWSMGKAYLNATASARREELQPTPLGQVIDHRFLGISPLVGKTSVCDLSMIYACLSLGVVFPSVVSNVVDFGE